MTIRTIAAKWHNTQTYGSLPYVAHLDDVAQTAHCYYDERFLFTHEDAMDVAYLHDVMEDCGILPSNLRQIGCNEAVIEAVTLVTDPTGNNRKERKALLHARLGALSVDNTGHALALYIKACDRAANIQRSRADCPRKLKMYTTEHKAFREATFRAGLNDTIFDWIDELLAGS